MEKFNTPLDIRFMGEQSVKLIAPLEFENQKFKIIVHEGFTFDGASIPRALWSVIGCPLGGIYTLAACIHDALYSSHLFDRKMSDYIFFRAMIASGTDRGLARKMYLAVRAFGEDAYNEKTEIQENRNLVEVVLK